MGLLKGVFGMSVSDFAIVYSVYLKDCIDDKGLYIFHSPDKSLCNSPDLATKDQVCVLENEKIVITANEEHYVLELPSHYIIKTFGNNLNYLTMDRLYLNPCATEFI